MARAKKDAKNFRRCVHPTGHNTVGRVWNPGDVHELTEEEARYVDENFPGGFEKADGFDEPKVNEDEDDTSSDDDSEDEE